MDNIDSTYKRMDKHKCYLEMAKLISKRSHDSQTQCGCVLVKSDRVISVGFNGFPIGFPDNKLPNIRPEKYRWILHSESNAVINAARAGISTIDSDAYVTGQCCPECLKILIQAGVRKIYIGYNTHSSAKSEKEFHDYLIKMADIELIELENNNDTA